MSSQPPGDDEFSDSDREWYATLSGQTSGDPTTRAGREALALRLALEQQSRARESDPELQAVISDEGVARMRAKLIDSARARGLFDAGEPPAAAGPDAAPPSNVIEFPWWRRRRPLLALAASVLVGALVLQQVVNRPDYGAEPQMSGVFKVLQVQSAEPKRAAEAFAAQLNQAGLRSGIYQRGKIYIVDVQLMASQLPTAEPPFKALGLTPQTGYNRVEFAPR